MTEAPITMEDEEGGQSANTEPCPGSLQTLHTFYCASIRTATEAAQQASEAGAIKSHLLTEETETLTETFQSIAREVGGRKEK